MRAETGQEGWLFADLVDFAGDIMALPVLSAPPPPTPAAVAPAANPQPASFNTGSRLVLANYFTWYDMGSWDDCNISAGDRPLQPYASDDPATIARHIDMARNAGIDGFTMQWAAPGDRTDRNFATILAKSAGSNFRSTVIFLRHIWPGASQANTIEALRYLMQQYAGHPNFLKIQGRPVIFITDVYRVPVVGGQTPQQAWAAIRQQVDPNHTAWWIAEGLDPSFLAVFDGLWVYKVTHAAYPNDYVKARRWAARVRSWAQKTGRPKLWVGTVMPGWDDRRAGCRPDIRVPSAPFARARDNGAFYRATFDAALKSNPDLLWVNSFNEWVEGSYIEPSQMYGDLYLNLTRELAARFKGG
ncbi:MAG: hypothetical protein GXP42_01095 [Chloroflexi bacterium]|nr:hypothetical protein [Chloroflexota bacterium]